jgi:acyl-CoA hydrolase
MLKVGKHFSFIFFALIFLLPPSLAYSQTCTELFALRLQGPDFAVDPDILETTSATKAVIEHALAIAKENNWPIKTLELGPQGRKIKRIFIGVDRTNEADLLRYFKEFLPNKAFGNGHAGTLPLEFAHIPGAALPYVYGYLRMSDSLTQNVYRYGKPQDTLAAAFAYIDKTNTVSQISHYAHLIGITEAELANFDTYIKNPTLRAPCKSDNCIAWTSSIELGKTAQNSTTEERKHLFNELDVARSYAPEEISKRFLHATNGRHRVVFVFYKGEQGRVEFDNLSESTVSPEPAIPYRSIIKNFEFQTKEISDAISVIADGSKVFVPIGAGASPEGVAELLKYTKTLAGGLDIHVLVNGVSEAAFKEGLADNPKARIHALFLGGNLRQLYSEGRVSVIPGYLGDFPRYVKNNNSDFSYDAILIRVSPANAQGFHSLGPNHDMIETILLARPNIKIIAEINKNIPVVTHGLFIHKDKITSSFNSDAKLAGPVTVPVTQVETSIGTYLGKLVPQNSTLQVGIGNIFGGLVYGLRAARVSGLQIWTEMFSDPMMELMNYQIATSATAGFVFGSTNLYNWLNNNEKIRLASTLEVNNVGHISATPQFHAINTALQVNLRGDVNATHGPEGRISSPGGQVEFMSGAARSDGGKSIIAIRSTAKNGTVSTIVLDTYLGSVTTTNENVTHVVTEFGIAELAGKSERARAVALLKISSPIFKKDLVEQALARNIITAEDAAEVLR